MGVEELVRTADITDVERFARFQYTVLDVKFDDPERQEAFEALTDSERERFFEIISENYSDGERERGY